MGNCRAFGRRHVVDQAARGRRRGDVIKLKWKAVKIGPVSISRDPELD
jgi:hypothetical protein